MSVATMLPSTHACELSSTLGFTSLPVNYVEWQYSTFLCDNLSRLWYINIHLSSVVHHRSVFPRTMIDWLLRLWIWLTRFSHRHNLKCETARITTSFWRLQICRRWYYSSTVLRKEWFTHPQASYLTSLLRHNPYPRKPLDVSNTHPRFPITGNLLLLLHWTAIEVLHLYYHIKAAGKVLA